MLTLPQLAEIAWPDTPFRLAENLNVPSPFTTGVLALVGRRGSEAHGTYISPTDPDSIDDRDIMGVVIPPPWYYMGLNQWEGAESIKGPWDVVLYEFRKFVNLLCKQNPNVLGMLWLEMEDYLHLHPAGMELVRNRKLFRARKAAYNAFTGYAMSQLKKMEHFSFQGYMGAKRKALVERYGYDCKCSAHLIRLLHMGVEFLRTGELTVKRTWDRDMLLNIKQGKWSLGQVKEHAEECFQQCKEEYQMSPLPDEIDMEAISHFVFRLVSGTIMR